MLAMFIYFFILKKINLTCNIMKVNILVVAVKCKPS